MRRAENFLWTYFLLPVLFLNAGNFFANVPEDDAAPPEVTARVARIGFLRGEAQVKRRDSTDWERAAPNLPLVEGDEIATNAGARLEIQFDSRNYLRLAENSYLKITTLKDEGISVSLPQGSLSARVSDFEKERAFFEIDAPQTTVAVQRAGTYRVDAQGENRKNSDVRVSVTDGGEARIYSETSGFTVRSGRSARIFLDGDKAGEWESGEAISYADDFDRWASERDEAIARRLQNAAYDKYYDRDIYGAEDLNEQGEWIYTRKYGNVWRPYKNATSAYANWSPYRYGQWRWIPPYGWTWVNDEPWGWATYHHGRWIYVDDNWAWTPYGQHRARRNWWQPALVIVTYAGSRICWYPLPYDYGYYNYNYNYSTYIDRRRTTIINNTTVIVNPTPTPITIDGGKGSRFQRKPPILEVPPTGVVSVEASEFGRRAKGFMTPPAEIATRVLSRTPTENGDVPSLPTYKDLNGKIDREILADNPPRRAETIIPQIRTGAGERANGGSIDETLRNEKIFGNRPPIERTPATIKAQSGAGENVEIRKTGAVRRLPPNSGEGNSESSGGFPTQSTGGRNQGNGETGGEQNISKPRGRNREALPPNYAPPQENAPPTTQESPRRERRQKPPEQEQPPQQQEERRRRESPPEREQAPPRTSPPGSEPKPPPQREQKPPASEQRRKIDAPDRQVEKPNDGDNR